jgi:hypothetical protein
MDKDITSYHDIFNSQESKTIPDHSLRKLQQASVQWPGMNRGWVCESRRKTEQKKPILNRWFSLMSSHADRCQRHRQFAAHCPPYQIAVGGHPSSAFPGWSHSFSETTTDQCSRSLSEERVLPNPNTIKWLGCFSDKQIMEKKLTTAEMRSVTWIQKSIEC